jgi:hypothetical protein
MNILKTSDERKTWSARLIAVCLIGAASIGLSAFSLRLNNAGRSEDLALFAGTWEAKCQGATFFTVHLTLANGSLGGTCVLGERWEIVDGELIPDGSELSTHKILEATASGKKLLLKISGNKIGDENSSEVVPVELTLTDRDQAEGRVAGSNSDTPPPQKEPWHFQRIGQ